MIFNYNGDRYVVRMIKSNQNGGIVVIAVDGIPYHIKIIDNTVHLYTYSYNSPWADWPLDVFFECLLLRRCECVFQMGGHYE